MNDKRNPIEVLREDYGIEPKDLPGVLNELNRLNQLLVEFMEPIINALAEAFLEADEEEIEDEGH